MESEYSFDELLCQSLLLFRENRIYGDGLECEEKASLMLREARCFMNESKDPICMAKWGCVVECLAQKFYINNETDAILEDIDSSLISFWKEVERTEQMIFGVFLWIGYYFLLRFKNSQSHFHTRSKKVIVEIVSCLSEIFRKFKNKGISGAILPFFKTDVWGETVYWSELVHDTRICERQSASLLEQLYNLKKAGLQQGGSGQNTLLQHVLEFYYF